MDMKKFHLSLVLTNQCNLNCVYCYESHKTKKSMDIQLAKNIIAEYLNGEDYDEVEIDFSGESLSWSLLSLREVCEWVWSRQWKNKYIFSLQRTVYWYTGR